MVAGGGGGGGGGGTGVWGPLENGLDFLLKGVVFSWHCCSRLEANRLERLRPLDSKKMWDSFSL